MADFPVVCANYGVQGTVFGGSCQTVCYFWNVRGVKVGVFGLSPALEGISTGKKTVKEWFLKIQ